MRTFLCVLFSLLISIYGCRKRSSQENGQKLENTNKTEVTFDQSTQTDQPPTDSSTKLDTVETTSKIVDPKTPKPKESSIEQRIATLEEVEDASFDITIPEKESDYVEVTVALTSKLKKTAGQQVFFVVQEKTINTVCAMMLEETALRMDDPALLKLTDEYKNQTGSGLTFTSEEEFKTDRGSYRIMIFVNQAQSQTP